MQRRNLLLFLMLLASMTSLFAGKLSLDQALESARNTNYTVKNADLTLAQKLHSSEVNTLLPSISLTAGISTNASLINTSLSTSYSIGGISFTLSSADKYTNEEQELAALSAQQTYISTLNTVESQVTQAYFSVVSAKLNVASQKLATESAQASYESMVEKYEGGRATTMEVNQAKLTLYDAELALETADQTLQTQIDDLSLLIGISEFDELDALLEIKEIKSLDSLLEMANNTSIKSLELALKQAQLAYTMEKNTALAPTISVSASTGLSGTLSSSNATIKDNTSLSVSVSLPLDAYLSNSSSQVSLKNKEIAVTIAQNNLEAERQSLQIQVKKAYQAVNQAKATVEKLEKHLQLAQDQQELVQASYDAGLSTYNDLTSSIKTVQSSEISILNQKTTYTQALYDLSYLLEVEIATLNNN